MITTGIPVTVAIFQWVSKYAASNDQWFNRQSDQHQLINQCFTTAKLTPEQTAGCVPDFLRWLSVMVAAFDGGILSGSLLSFMDHDDKVTLTWESSMTQSLSVSGWDRSTRLAVDYIMNRACSISDFQSNIGAGLVMVNRYLKFYQNELHRHVAFMSSAIDSSQTTQDDDVQFLILSSIPAIQLQSFYESLVTLLPEDFHFAGPSEPLAANVFFGQPVSSDMLMVDKVKMHYNLVFHSEIDPDLKTSIMTHTAEFIDNIKLDSTVWRQVQDELSVILNDQFLPRLSFLTMVLEVFQWPK